MARLHLLSKLVAYWVWLCYWLGYYTYGNRHQDWTLLWYESHNQIKDKKQRCFLVHYYGYQWLYHNPLADLDDPMFDYIFSFKLDADLARFEFWYQAIVQGWVLPVRSRQMQACLSRLIDCIGVYPARRQAVYHLLNTRVNGATIFYHLLEAKYPPAFYQKILGCLPENLTHAQYFKLWSFTDNGRSTLKLFLENILCMATLKMGLDPLVHLPQALRLALWEGSGWYGQKQAVEGSDTGLNGLEKKLLPWRVLSDNPALSTKGIFSLPLPQYVWKSAEIVLGLDQHVLRQGDQATVALLVLLHRPYDFTLTGQHHAITYLGVGLTQTVIATLHSQVIAALLAGLLYNWEYIVKKETNNPTKMVQCVFLSRFVMLYTSLQQRTDGAPYCDALAREISYCGRGVINSQSPLDRSLWDALLSNPTLTYLPPQEQAALSLQAYAVYQDALQTGPSSSEPGSAYLHFLTNTASETARGALAQLCTTLAQYHPDKVGLLLGGHGQSQPLLTQWAHTYLAQPNGDVVAFLSRVLDEISTDWGIQYSGSQRTTTHLLKNFQWHTERLATQLVLAHYQQQYRDVLNQHTDLKQRLLCVEKAIKHPHKSPSPRVRSYASLSLHAPQRIKKQSKDKDDDPVQQSTGSSVM